MELFLIRHAEAVALGNLGITDDTERPLTDKGHQQALGIGKGLAKKGVRFDKLVTSPLVRARQTAEGMLSSFNPVPELLICDDLVPEGRARRVARFLRDLTGDRIGLVGHMPSMGILAAWLIGSKKAQVDFAKAGVACIHSSDQPGKGDGILAWLVTPDWLMG